jgi:hypothetical protein
MLSFHALERSRRLPAWGGHERAWRATVSGPKKRRFTLLDKLTVLVNYRANRLG